MFLLKTHKLTFYRTAAGYYDDNGDWVEQNTTLDVVGNLQPAQYKRKTKTDLRGSWDRREYIFYTKERLESVSNTSTPDYTFIDGVKHAVKREDVFSGYGLLADHYRYLLASEDDN